MNMVTRIGMLTPSSNTWLEPLTQEMARGLPGVSVHFTRLPVVTLGLSAKEASQFEIDTMVAAARLLADAGVDVIAWNGTSGSWLGLDHDRAIVDAVQAATGIPASTSTLAFFKAFEWMGVQRYGLAVPYTDDVTERIIETYEQEGLECVAEAHLGLRINTDIGNVYENQVAELISRVAVAEADAVAVVCTNFAGASVAERVERESGTIVIDSIAVTLWHSLLVAGYPVGQLKGWGELFRTDAPRPASVPPSRGPE